MSVFGDFMIGQAARQDKKLERLQQEFEEWWALEMRIVQTKPLSKEMIKLLAKLDPEHPLRKNNTEEEESLTWHATLPGGSPIGYYTPPRAQAAWRGWQAAIALHQAQRQEHADGKF